MIEMEGTITQAYLRCFPTDHELSIKVLQDEGESLIVRVYIRVPKLLPSPYLNLRFDKESQDISELTPEESDRFVIKNYK
jgi:hypothetical protein